MTSRPFDLAVAYRVYPGTAGTAFIHPRDKLQLATLCFASFVQALGALRAKVWLLLDGCPPEYESVFRARYSGALEIERFSGIGNVATYVRQLDVLETQEDADWVYVAEDDYLYRPGALERMLAFLTRRAPGDFASPYDHLDYYSHIHLHAHRFREERFDDIRWRESVYTCLTFMASRQTLTRYDAALKAYARGAMDNSMWMAITKFNVLNPYRLLKYFVRDRRFLFPTVWNAWRYSWRQVLFGKRTRLWTPVPSLSTHTHARFLAPNVDWNQVAAAVEAGPGPHAEGAHRKE